VFALPLQLGALLLDATQEDGSRPDRNWPEQAARSIPRCTKLPE